MKQSILLMATLMVAFLTSCSTNNTEDTVKELSILRGKDTKTSIVIPLHTTIQKNVYKIGDTVWAVKREHNNVTSWAITGEVWSLELGSANYRTFVIEEDNDIQEQINYKDSIRR